MRDGLHYPVLESGCLQDWILSGGSRQNSFLAFFHLPEAASIQQLASLPPSPKLAMYLLVSAVIAPYFDPAPPGLSPLWPHWAHPGNPC